MKQTLDDKLMEISSMADQITAIAFAAINAPFGSRAIEPKREDLLRVIAKLSDTISSELDALIISWGKIGEVVV